MNPPEKPAATYQEDLYAFEWPESGISATVERFNEERGDVRCELTVTSAHPTKGGHLIFARLLLLGPNSRRDLARQLAQRDDSIDWAGVLEQLCTLSIRRYREGPPAIDLWHAKRGERGRYLVRPFVFDDAVNLIYGSGDSGKSLFTLMLALAVASGEEIAGIVPERTGPVLYLDWEDSYETHQERLHALGAAAGLVVPEQRIIYRRMAASLSAAVRDVRKDVARTGAIMAIVDSLGMACGGDPSDAGGVIEAMIAARSLGIATVGVHHIAKDAKDKSTPYGSVYASNEARMSWHVESERVQDQLTVVLTNWKSNRGKRHERQSFRFNFTEGEEEQIERIDVSPTTFGQSKEIGDGGQKWRIAAFLDHAGLSTVAAIASEVDLSPARVRTLLHRFKGDLFVQIGVDWARHSVTSQDYHSDEGITSQEGPFKGPGVTPETQGNSEGEGETIQVPPWDDEQGRLDSLQGIA